RVDRSRVKRTAGRLRAVARDSSELPVRHLLEGQGMELLVVKRPVHQGGSRHQPQQPGPSGANLGPSGPLRAPFGRLRAGAGPDHTGTITDWTDLDGSHCGDRLTRAVVSLRSAPPRSASFGPWLRKVLQDRSGVVRLPRLRWL